MRALTARDDRVGSIAEIVRKVKVLEIACGVPFRRTGGLDE
jgi:hypothetical protein